MTTRGIAGVLASLALLAGVSAARGQADQSPEQFLRKLYAQYLPHHPDPDPLGKQAGQLFAAPLLRLIRLDQQRARGEVGELDHDPICACQDYENLHVQDISVQPGDGAVLATVKFINIDEPETVKFKLVTVDSHWRIADIGESDIESLLEYLRKALHQH